MVDVEPVGEQAVVRHGRDGVALWDLQKGQLVTNLLGHRGTVLFAAFPPDGARLVTMAHDGTALLWDVESLTADPDPAPSDPAPPEDER